jgi:hypothetical protein
VVQMIWGSVICLVLKAARRLTKRYESSQMEAGLARLRFLHRLRRPLVWKW